MLVVAHAQHNPYYRKAVETPAYRDAMELRAEAIRRRAQLEPIAALPLPPSVRCDLDDWEDLAVTLAAADQARTVRMNAYNSLIAQCEREIASVVHQKDRLLASIAADLDQVMSRVSVVVAALNAARNAGEAIDLDVAEQWRQLLPLRAEYDQVRQAQDWALGGDHRATHTRSNYLYDDDLASEMRLANIAELFPAWKDPAPNHALQNWDTGRAQPWPGHYADA